MRQLRAGSTYSARFVIVAVLCLPALRSSMLGDNSLDVFGNRFRCGNPAGVSLCLPTLRPGCSLTITQGKGIPREPGDQVILSHGEETRAITEPDQLSGCVTRQALRGGSALGIAVIPCPPSAEEWREGPSVSPVRCPRSPAGPARQWQPLGGQH